MSKAAEPSGLLFRWQKARGVLSWLPLFLLISILAHAGTFFVFQVVYPQRATLPPQPPQVTVLSDTPENASLLRWIEAEDPALVAAPPRLQPPKLVTPTYRPSFEVIRTAPRMAAEKAPLVPPAPARDPISIIRSSTSSAPASAQPRQPQPTRIHFSGALAKRSTRAAEEAALTKSATPLDPATFLIGVTDRGEVRFHFLQKSSGDSAVDASAAEHLAQLSFDAAPGAPITWGMATFAWGDDAFAAAAEAESR